MKVWIIIPAYNEENSLKSILQDLKSNDVSVLVVDDGSKDNTYAAAEESADIVIRNEKNFGKGASLKRGITYLLKNEDFDYIITMDADGQHSISDFKKFFNEAKKGACFILGNRMESPSGMPRERVLTNKCMSGFISLLVGQRILDTQCGFRMIKRDVLEKIAINTKNFEVESEILIKAARLGVFIKSVPIQSIYYSNMRSKIHPFFDTVRFIRFIFNLPK